MHIYVSVAMARDKETLERDVVKSGSIYEVENHDEFTKWLGWIFSRVYDLYRITEATDNNPTPEQEVKLNELMRDPIFLELIDWAMTQKFHADQKKMIYNKIIVKCGSFYHPVVNSINESGIKVADGAITFKIAEQEGSYRNATLSF